MASAPSTCDVNCDLNGVMPLPVNACITLEFNNVMDGAPFHAEQSIIQIGDAARLFQRVARLLEKKSLSSPDMPFRESGALIFVYSDGRSQWRSFTSNLYNRIKGEAHDAAIRKTRILQELSEDLKPKFIVHMHTHPGPEYRPEDARDMTMLMNENDLSCYQSLSAFFSGCAAQDIPVIGVVRPVGAKCGDVLITTQINPYDASGGAARKLGRALRAQYKAA